MFDGVLKQVLVSLECASCNSRLGTLCDSELRRELEFLNAWEGGKRENPTTTKPVKAMMECNKLLLPVELSRLHGALSIANNLGTSNPKNARIFFEASEQNPNLTFNVRARWLNESKVRAALLHAAYLSMFRVFGYEYLLHVDLQWVRDILTATDLSTTIDVPICHVEHAKVQGSPVDAIHSIAVVLVEEKYKCLAAIFPTPFQRYAMVLVLLPGFFDTGQRMYNELVSRAIDDDARIECKFHKIRREGYLADSAFKNFGHRLWQHDFPNHDN